MPVREYELLKMLTLEAKPYLVVSMNLYPPFPYLPSEFGEIRRGKSAHNAVEHLQVSWKSGYFPYR